MPDSFRETLIGSELNNLIVLRSFSKIYGLAGLRVGYAYSNNKKLLKEIENHNLAWGISSLSEYLAIKLLNTDTTKTALKIAKIRDHVFKKLKKFKNIKVFPSQTNFLLIKLKNARADYLFDKLLSKRILIRNCKNIRGLDNSFIRISIKDAPSMELFLTSFEEAMNEI